MANQLKRTVFLYVALLCMVLISSACQIPDQKPAVPANNCANVDLSSLHLRIAGEGNYTYKIGTGQQVYLITGHAQGSQILTNSSTVLLQPDEIYAVRVSSEVTIHVRQKVLIIFNQNVVEDQLLAAAYQYQIPIVSFPGSGTIYNPCTGMNIEGKMENYVDF